MDRSQRRAGKDSSHHVSFATSREEGFLRTLAAATYREEGFLRTLAACNISRGRLLHLLSHAKIGRGRVFFTLGSVHDVPWKASFEHFEVGTTLREAFPAGYSGGTSVWEAFLT